MNLIVTKNPEQYEENYEGVYPVVEVAGYRSAKDQILDILEAGERLYEYRSGYYHQEGVSDGEETEWEGDEDSVFEQYHPSVGLGTNYDLSDMSEDEDYLQYARRKNAEKAKAKANEDTKTDDDVSSKTGDVQTKEKTSEQTSVTPEK